MAYSVYRLATDWTFRRLNSVVKYACTVAHAAFCEMGTGHVSRGQRCRSVALTTHFRVAPRLKMNKYMCTVPLFLHGRLGGDLYLKFLNFYTTV